MVVRVTSNEDEAAGVGSVTGAPQKKKNKKNQKKKKANNQLSAAAAPHDVNLPDIEPCESKSFPPPQSASDKSNQHPQAVMTSPSVSSSDHLNQFTQDQTFLSGSAAPAPTTSATTRSRFKTTQHCSNSWNSRTYDSL